MCELELSRGCVVTAAEGMSLLYKVFSASASRFTHWLLSVRIAPHPAV